MSWGAVQTKEVKTTSAVNRHIAMFEKVREGFYWVVLHMGVATSATTVQQLQVGIVPRDPVAGEQLDSTLANAVAQMNNAGYIRTMPGRGVASGAEMNIIQSEASIQCSPVGKGLIVVPPGHKLVAWESTSAAFGTAHTLMARIVYLEIPVERCVPFI